MRITAIFALLVANLLIVFAFLINDLAWAIETAEEQHAYRMLDTEIMAEDGSYVPISFYLGGK